MGIVVIQRDVKGENFFLTIFTGKQRQRSTCPETKVEKYIV